MLSDHPDRAVLPGPSRRPTSAEKFHWSDGQKLEAIKLYLLLGNVALTAATLKIPDVTLREWRRKQWWKDLEQELKAQESILVSNRLKSIVDKTLVAIDDRIENGEFQWDQKQQKLIRKPVKLRDLTTAANVLMERNSAIVKEQQQEQIGTTTSSIKEQLDVLASEFAKFNNRGKQGAQDIPFLELPLEVSDAGDNENAVHDEREEGLQA